MTDETNRCGAWAGDSHDGCVLPKGHNAGRADVPANHEFPDDALLTHHEIPVDDGPALYYLGTDGTLRRLDADLPELKGGGEWVLDISPRERALCRALLAMAIEYVGRP